MFSVHLLYKWDGKAGFPALLPLIINIAAVALLIVLPFRKISNRLDYSLFLSSRLEVIEKIESGELMPDGNGVVWLPAKYAAVSDGGAVDLVSWYDGKVCFCFYTFAGMLDSYCGFAYLAETSVAESDSFLEIQLGDSYGGGWHVFSGG
ncbi:MAG: hypothetical protein LBQ91_01630 [Oscillospiraceae bacterium]|nr:hypothetical protein [Oscillospiraceae bacterium]